MLSPLEVIQDQNTALESRFTDKLRTNSRLNRQLVSFQANKNKPIYRWFRYKEGFSEPLINYLLDYLNIENGQVLDPFAGVGTTLFAAAEHGLNAVGIELLPIGCEVMNVRQFVQNSDHPSLAAVLRHWRDVKPWKQVASAQPFPHLRITDGAFPAETQAALENYLTAANQESELPARVLRFAALCVLEAISYTRKDGQYLRWDYRSGRRQGSKPFNKGEILGFEDAITQKLDEILTDLQPPGLLPGFAFTSSSRGNIQVLRDSCLHSLPTLETASFDAVITSPPYANRYDYTRTYALELALLGVGENDIRHLRQSMISCTVENRAKPELADLFSQSIYQAATQAFDRQRELHGILDYLEALKRSKVLNNSGIPRMLRNYFFEMSLVIFECARLLKPGAPFVMVNDNVRYGGAAVPVDLILSDFAETAGFDVDIIWVLPTSKGNSSQQMGAHGREEVRKCIYIWRKSE
jgi:DNA modification methylase